MIHDDNGEPVRVYSNDDIEEYARAWTGFHAQKLRGNIEPQTNNRIDPMRINNLLRDRLPKMGVSRKYIGDGYPLCSDLPTRHFLVRGATYRLLGSSSKAELHNDPPMLHPSAVQFILEPESHLYEKLCNAGAGSMCNYLSVVVLNETVACLGRECSVDAIRSVSFNAERTRFSTAQTRCQLGLCRRGEQAPRQPCDHTDKTKCWDRSHFWTDQPCSLQAKIIRDSGKVGIVHVPPAEVGSNNTAFIVREDTKTFFRVDWEGDIQAILSNCTNIPSCREAEDNSCLCDVSVVQGNVFSGASIPNHQEILANLDVGSFIPDDWSGTSHDDVTAYNLGSDGSLMADSAFEVVDDSGRKHVRKNMKSSVVIVGTDVSFRNPVHFSSLADPDPRDAHYETDATLDHYFYHPNTAPFLSTRFAQRFSISNPSPRYVEKIATAFRSGHFNFTEGGRTTTFGSGGYGDLRATFAAILLDREARNVLLDNDPTHGALKEPLIKLIGLMRSLEFQLNDPYTWVQFDRRLRKKIGQMAHDITSVFSFFLPDYQPPGPVALGSLRSPEARVLTGPSVISALNGLFSLIKYGLSDCVGGHGLEGVIDCDKVAIGMTNISTGGLNYLPESQSESSDSSEEVIDELAMLMTSGRLSHETRELIRRAYDENQEDNALLKAQLLTVAAPEFHVTNTIKRKDTTRERPSTGTAQPKPYKALVNNDGAQPQDWPDGSYRICSIQYNGKRVGMTVEHPTEGCIAMVFGDPQSSLQKWTNPPVYGVNNITNTSLMVPLTVLEIPLESASVIDERLRESRNGEREEAVFALWNGSYYIHDPRFQLLSNTLDNPLPDGGVTPRALRAIYQVTRDDPRAETAFLYAMEGLDIQRDPQVTAPCVPGSRSRWLSVPCSNNARFTDVNETTATVLARQLSQAVWREMSDRQAAGRPDMGPPILLDVWRARTNLQMKRVMPPIWTRKALKFQTFGDLVAVGRMFIQIIGTCPARLGSFFDFFELPLELRTQQIAQALGIDLASIATEEESRGPSGSRTLVCGSPFEVANEPSLGGSAINKGAFDASTVYLRSTTSADLELQRRAVWIKAVLEDPGQLRQRVAWALSQLLVISPATPRSTESYLAFYDIMVRQESCMVVVSLVFSSPSI
ncbi:Protein of unknown function (DUF1800) [Seminavis robusta]|uniref:Uncharacterized protein n=1 Tax=Seminavis robusta TaxID=568900 RepID=A0A9N8E3F7_9STRA|nr:Protein of unknown function (DUF1800) [Seminavis robusta]|eukprot:Sro612_g175470.1 Protein of unknown function (DUF1800) (1141) ;mRNA; f:30369-34870